MVVSPSVLGELRCQVQKENIRKVRILGEDLCRGFFDNQAGYLRPPKRVDVEWEELDNALKLTDSTSTI